MEMIIDVLADALADCLKMLPFLFAAFLLIEGLEHYSTKLTRKALEDVDKAGPVVGVYHNADFQSWLLTSTQEGLYR